MNALRKSDLDDWYVVDGCFGQPEGSAEEWRIIIKAIEEGQSARAGRRLGVRVRENGDVEFYSPRNATGPEDVVRVSREEIGIWMSVAKILLGLWPASNGAVRRASEWVKDLDAAVNPQQMETIVRAIQIEVEQATAERYRKRKCVHCGQTQPR